jgi:hypothetical protein
MDNPYPELAAVLSAQAPSTAALDAVSIGRNMAATAVLPAAPSIGLATAATAVSQAMAMLDSQLTAVEQTNVVPNFPGAQPMVNALGQMKQAAGQWPAVKSSLLVAAMDTVNAGPAASRLGVGNTVDAATLAAVLSAFVTSVLQPLQRRYRDAQTSFDTFSDTLARVESAAAVANTDAVKALDATQADIQSRVDDINAKINDLKSAGSIIVGILSGGISIAVQLKNLQDEIASLRDAERAATLQRQAYAMAYSQFTNACSAEVLAVKATATLNTALEQAVNALNDIVANSSGSLVVMQAYLTSFREEFAGAVSASRSMLN